mmetsp:Transcript_42376/g.126796  ORF Transcript_42376/g.126796 Transcript_42376/m.126796 type:complete len:205 (+) Transcript_42376:753-1367(+)
MASARFRWPRPRGLARDISWRGSGHTGGPSRRPAAPCGRAPPHRAGAVRLRRRGLRLGNRPSPQQPRADGAARPTRRRCRRRGSSPSGACARGRGRDGTRPQAPAWPRSWSCSPRLRARRRCSPASRPRRSSSQLPCRPCRSLPGRAGTHQSRPAATKTPSSAREGAPSGPAPACMRRADRSGRNAPVPSPACRPRVRRTPSRP